MGVGRPERSISSTEWLISSDEAAPMSSGESDWNLFFLLEFANFLFPFTCNLSPCSCTCISRFGRMSLLTEKGLEKFKDHGEVPEDRFGNVFTSFTLLNQFGCSAERSLLEIFSSHGTHGADQDAPSHGLSEVTLFTILNLKDHSRHGSSLQMLSQFLHPRTNDIFWLSQNKVNVIVNREHLQWKTMLIQAMEKLC